MTEDLARTPIAIVGVSALTPGASDVAGLWRCVLAGQDLITDVPASRWLVEDYYDPDPTAEDKTYGKRGAFLSPVAFDALGFGMPPNNVAATDTTQLLALITAERVLADATGGDLDSLDRDRVSVVLGTAPLDLLVSMSNRLQRPVWIKALREHGIPESQAQAICDTIADSYVPWQEASFPGLLSNVVAGRIANRFDLHGVNHTVDAACASSLAALLSAMNELQLGRSDLVVTGGVDTLNDILMYMCFSKTPALSPTGDCRPFSETADGTMLGEGLVMFALKRLADAERDGNKIYAVIRGLGTSSDGRSTAIYAPLADGQSRALDRAYQAAGYGPDTVELIEAHGTGTVAGDGAEVAALRAVFDAAGRTDRQWCALGSVKSQIGHTKSAAGAVGLLKAVLALQHQILPPTIKVDRPNPRLELESSPFYLNTQARPWIRGSSHPRRASVSSFGFGGSNFHVTVEEYAPSSEGGQCVTDGQVTPCGQAAKRVRAMPTELVLLGAATADALLARCGDVAALDRTLAEIARESQCSRWQSAQVRLGVVASDTDDLKAKLSQAVALIKKNPGASWSLPTGLHYGASPAPRGDIAFVFSGQGSQYVGMGADIAMAYPQSRSAWDWAADINLGSQHLHEVVFPPPAFTEADRDAQQARLTATEWAQPALAVASLAALGLLDVLGITPDCVAGHSFGELVALHVAGSYDRLTLLRLARLRGELMRDAASAPGAMLAVAASAQDAKAVLASAGAGELWLANDNGPAQVVLSGIATAVDAAAEHCQRAGIQARRLNAATAFHSPIVTPAGAPLLEFLLGADVRQPQLPAYGNADAALYPADPDAIRQRIAAHLSAPVRFADEIEAMYAAGTQTFIEVGAGATLTGLVAGILGDRPHLAVSLDRKGQNGVTRLHNALAQLAVHGLDMNLEALWEPYAAPPAPRQTQSTGATLMISGGNYGQPYPPEAGATGLPGPSQAPQPPIRQDAALRQTSPPPANRDANGRAASRTLHHAAGRAAAAHQAPAHGESMPQSLPSAPSLPPTGPDVGWLHAVQEANRETAEAHASYQRLMADSHAAFLQMAEGSLARFAATANGRPIAAASQVPAERVYAPPASPPRPAAELLTVPGQRAPGPDGPAPPPSIADAVDPGVLAATQPSVASVGQAVDLESLVLAAVAEATGYPEDMLGPDMQLEADLGIDSIKRVQILSKLREALPALPEFRAADIGKFQTLGSIVTALEAASDGSAYARAENAPSPTAAVPAVDLESLVLAAVAEATGYPEDMLGPDMQLEADLGIDSIKRVQILSKLREALPALPEFRAADIGKFQTLGSIVTALEAASDGSAYARAENAPSPTAAVPAVDLESLVLAAVAEATGYPEDMLGPDMQLEADLGIDSIKRVQILSKLREALPALPEFRAADIGKFQTLGSIVTALRTTAGEPPAAAQAEAGPSDSAPADSDALPAPPVRSTEPDTDRPLARRVVRVAAAQACGFATAGLGRGPIVVTDDGAGLANLVVGGLAAHGVAATVADEVPIDAPGLIFLGGMRATGTVDAAVHVNREAFRAARTIAPRLSAEGGVFVTVQDTGGDFGLSARTADRAWLGGLAALALTALREWPHASVRAVDCERGDRPAAEIAAAIVRELLTGGATPRVGLRSDGTRLVPEVVAGGVGAAAEPHVGPDSVIVATGGGRGVTATALRALAATHQPAIALLGRTVLAEEPPEARGIDDERSLQRVFIEAIRAQTGTAPAPAQVGARVAQVRQAREIRATIDALQRAGSRVRYLAVDVCDADAVAAALADVRRDWGPVTGLIHGAGVLADKTIADKTDQQFALVFDTKVMGLRALLAATAVDPLRLICLFSSVAARYGNAGQSDYAMANAVLDQVASAEAARRPDCLVRAMGWGPWDGGMVTPSLATHFRDRGVALIRPEAGGQAFVAEMAGTPGDVQVVVTGDEDDPLGGPERAGLAAEIRISARSHPHLDDHRVADVPVVPVALVLDWFAVAADETIGRLVPLVVRDLDVLRGIGLDHFGNGGNCLTVRARHQLCEDRPHLALELTGDSGTTHYRASVDLDPQPGVARTGWAPLTGLETASSPAIYDGKVLFHGPSFQALRALHAVSSSGAAADVAGVTEMSWPGGPWRTDPAAIDGGLQLALLWGERVLGGPSLPMSVRECRINKAGPAEGTLRCVLRAVRTADAHAECDIALLDPDGTTRAELLGVTVVGRPR